MRRIALIMLLAGSPAAAQDSEDDQGPFARGVEQMLRDLFSEVEPRLREFRDTIDDLGDYEAPEMLPNGDIIIRRRPPQQPPPEPDEPEADSDGPIDL